MRRARERSVATAAPLGRLALLARAALLGRTALLAAALLAAAPPAAAAAQDLAVVGGELRPVSGPAIEDGVVVIRAGRIVAVGARGRVAVPAGTEVLDAAGLVVTPGFIDARTSVGRGRGAASDEDALIRSPAVRMADFLEPPRLPEVFGMEALQPAVHPWVMDGVTTVYVAPGTENLVAGFGAVVKLVGADPGRPGAVLDSAAALHVTLGDGPREEFDSPTTRQGMVALLRQWLRRAAAASPGGAFTLGAPAADIEGRETASWSRTPDLAAVLAGERPVRFHAQTPDEVATALRVADEFGLAAVLEGATSAHLVAASVADAGVPVVLGPAIVGADGSMGAPERFAQTAGAAALLRRAGVPVALSTGDAGGRSVTVEAVVARGHGLAADDALRALTLDAARILGVAERVGSLEPGKDADLVLWSGDPVGTWGVAEVVVVDGVVVYGR